MFSVLTTTLYPWALLHAQTVTPTPATPATESSSAAVGNAVGDAVASPFQDLNLVRTKIPPALAALNNQPYGPPQDTSCVGLTAAVMELDGILGPDLDTQAVAGNRARSAATSALQGAAHGVVPFRSWVRKLTGAETHARKLAMAIITGTARRAYLKGLGQAEGCSPPAAPLLLPAVTPAS